MKTTTTLFLSLASALSLQAQETYLNTNFNSGIPSEYTTIDVDDLPINNGFSIPVEGNWFCQGIYGAEGKAAVSTSRHTFNLPADNWLITPQIEIKSADAILTWDAKSVHYDLRDGYSILISTTDNDPENFVEIDKIDEESYTWQHHLIALGDYVGKKIYIAIQHNSMNKFLLAIDNIYVGVPQKLSFDVDNQTQHFCGNTEKVPVKGAIRNLGKTVTLSKIICTSGLNVLTKDLKGTAIKAGTKLDFNFEIPVTLNTAVPYQIDLVTTEGESYTVLEDNIHCSYFPRTLLVEKGTGVWCTSCPGVMGYMNELKEEYKDEVVLIESHSSYNNYANMAYAPYDLGMATGNYPVIYFNRNHKNPAYNKGTATECIKDALAEETPALISATANLKDGQIAVKAEMSFGKAFNNSKDQFRIGFAILEKHKQLTFPIQKSSVSGPQYEEFGFLSSPIDKDLMFFHNTVKGTSSAFNGVAKSLPANIEVGMTYNYEGTIDLPEGFESADNLTVVAFVLDYFNNDVLNATEIKIGDAQTGINLVEASVLDAEINLNYQQCAIQLPDTAPYHVVICNANGQQIINLHGTGNQITLPTNAWGKGAVILSIYQNGKNTTKKIIVD